MEPVGNLLEEVKITKLNDATAAGTSAINSTVVDMAGFDGVVFMTNSGAIAATGTAVVKVQQDTAVAWARLPIWRALGSHSSTRMTINRWP